VNDSILHIFNEKNNNNLSANFHRDKSRNRESAILILFLNFIFGSFGQLAVQAVQFLAVFGKKIV